MRIIEGYFNTKGRISHHAISTFMYNSPKEFKLYMDGLYQDEDTRDMKKGRVLHKFLLEKEQFDDCYFLQEGSDGAGLMDKFIALYATREDLNFEGAYSELPFKWKIDQVQKEFQKEENQIKYKRLLENKGKEPVSQEQLDSCNYISESVKNHKTAYRLLYPSENITAFREPEVYWTNSRGQDCKAKMDIVNVDPVNRTIELCELKKTAFHPRKFESTIKYRGYYRQLSWYKNEALPQFLLQNDINPDQFQVLNRIIVCQDHYPNIVRVIQLDDVDMTEGQIEYEQTLDQIKWHMDNDFWEKREYKDREEWIDFISIFGEKD